VKKMCSATTTLLILTSPWQVRGQPQNPIDYILSDKNSPIFIRPTEKPTNKPKSYNFLARISNM